MSHQHPPRPDHKRVAGRHFLSPLTIQYDRIEMFTRTAEEMIRSFVAAGGDPRNMVVIFRRPDRDDPAFMQEGGVVVEVEGWDVG